MNKGRICASMRCTSCLSRSLTYSTLQPFTSPHGRRLFLESSSGSTLQPYLPLAAQRCPQPHFAAHGASTLTVVLNAMGVDPGRVWKWPWRWYSETMLPPGPCGTLAEFAALAASQGVASAVARTPAASEGRLREAVLYASARPQGGQFLVAAYHRPAIAGQGEGGPAAAAPAPAATASQAHFSLLAGFHPAEDAALLIDVHPALSVPSWVSLSALHNAMQRLPGGGGFALLAAAGAEQEKEENSYFRTLQHSRDTA
jgi:glutathione gamma-glutamylcysteinyltransferase